MWAQLPTDTHVNLAKRHRPTLPKVFSLFDGTARCSCGNNNYNEEKSNATISPYIIYTSTTAIQLAIETVYCRVCRNTHGKIGPDLGNYGILNWNNKVGFTHHLLNLYTSLLTHSETPFNAYYQTIKDHYFCHESPIGLCDNETFEYAWFAFIRLQKIESNMRCSQCGDDPKVVIADGVCISFPSHHRTETLRPPTVYDKTHAWTRLQKTATRSTTFIGPVTLRRGVYNALNTSSKEERLRKLTLQIEALQRISVFPHCYICLQFSE
jgi:hypothetical protein